jgi:hypothetical protein
MNVRLEKTFPTSGTVWSVAFVLQRTVKPPCVLIRIGRFILRMLKPLSLVSLVGLEPVAEAIVIPDFQLAYAFHSQLRSAPMLQPTPGQWYISLVCEFCKRRIILFPDLNEGTSDLMNSRISMICPKCQTETSSAVEHYLHLRKRPSGELPRLENLDYSVL